MFLSMVVWNHSKSRTKYKDQLWHWQKKQTRKKKETETERAKLTGADPHRFPLLRESVRFFIINIFLVIIIIELFKLKFGKWSGQLFSFSSFRAFYASSIDQKPRSQPRKGNFGVHVHGLPWELAPSAPPLGNRSWYLSYRMGLRATEELGQRVIF